LLVRAVAELERIAAERGDQIPPGRSDVERGTVGIAEPRLRRHVLLLCGGLHLRESLESYRANSTVVRSNPRKGKYGRAVPDDQPVWELAITRGVTKKEIG